jgi:hypothetical protein
LPFKCRGCHEYGHFQKHCPKNQPTQQEKEQGEGWQQPKRPKPNPKSTSRREGKTPNPNSTNPSKNKETQKTPIETENSFSGLGDLEAEAKDPNESVVECQSNQEGKRPDGKELPPFQDSGDISEAQEAGKEAESSEEEEDEFDISQTSPKQVTRGRKMKKKGGKQPPTRTWFKDLNQHWKKC